MIKGSQVRTFKALMGNLNINCLNLIKRTTRVKVKSNQKQIALNNHASNPQHQSFINNKLGFELKLTYPDEIKNNRSFVALLLTVTCFLKIHN